MATTVGLAQFVITTGDRALQALLGRLYPFADKQNKKRFKAVVANRSLRRRAAQDAKKLAKLIRRMNSHTLTSKRAAKPYALVFSDASGGEDTVQGKPVLGAVLITATRHEFFTYTLDDCWVAELLEGAGIEVLEMVAKWLAGKIWGETLVDNTNLKNIDNTTALYASAKFVGPKTRAESAFTAKWGKNVIAKLAMDSAAAAYDGPAMFVKSELNLADFPTRPDLLRWAVLAGAKQVPLTSRAKSWTKLQKLLQSKVTHVADLLSGRDLTF